MVDTDDMTQDELDLWSDINNPNNDADMDDWADSHNPNNDNYLDDDVQNKMRNEIEDYLFQFKDQKDLPITFDEIDEIMEACIDIAKVRRK